MAASPFESDPLPVFGELGSPKAALTGSNAAPPKAKPFIKERLPNLLLMISASLRSDSYLCPACPVSVWCSQAEVVSVFIQLFRNRFSFPWIVPHSIMRDPKGRKVPRKQGAGRRRTGS